MPRTLLISVRFHDGRYHGSGDWPPAPARLFQAFVAGAASGKSFSDGDKDALSWLEALKPPIVAAPAARLGQGFTNFVPNNDLDAVDGDPRRIGEIRAGKSIRPRLFEAEVPLLYAWMFDGGGDGDRHVRAICEIADSLYQLGRGVDMAWACGEVIDEKELDVRFTAYVGVLHRPTKSGADKSLSCPQPGSLESLIDRFTASRQRFQTTGKGKKSQLLFSQAPKPRFASVAYDSPPTRFVFDLRMSDSDARFAPWSLANTAGLVTRLRDAAVERLTVAMPKDTAKIERVLIGRDATEADKPQRVRIVPLPSIGHSRADRAIRRVLVEVPPDCPLRADDIAWAFSGLMIEDQIDPQTGEVLWEAGLVPAQDEAMLRHFGIGVESATHRWRTVTPAVLPERAARRRIDPGWKREEAKSGRERVREESRAVTAVLQALRHANINAPVESIRVQREPFEARGSRAESFAAGTRFLKERLWHVEIVFAEPISGPIILGDGRYLGLGLFAAVSSAEPERQFQFVLMAAERLPIEQTLFFAERVKAALLAQAKGLDGPDSIPGALSGHEADGRPLRRGSPRHVFVLPEDADRDGILDHLLVWFPDGVDDAEVARAGRAVERLTRVRLDTRRIVALGRLRNVEPRLSCGRGRTWVSETPYLLTRFPKSRDRCAVLAEDIARQCLIFGLPAPDVQIIEDAPSDWITRRRKPESPQPDNRGAFLRLSFSKPITGPLVLGRHRHLGLGIFRSDG